MGGDSPLGIVLIGSSGGGKATTGNHSSLFTAIAKELATRSMELVDGQFIVSDTGFDVADPDTAAELWILNTTDRYFYCLKRGSLKEINEAAVDSDARIAQRIHSGAIAAIISVSSDTDGVNNAVFQAAADNRVPVVGTGGTSISKIAAMGCHVLSNSGGSVSTNPESKALIFTSALVRVLPGAVHRPSANGTHESSIPTQSILAGCLPIYLSVALIESLREHSEWISGFPVSLLPAQELIHQALGTSLTTIAAATWGTCGELDVIAGSAASCSVQGTSIGGALAVGSVVASSVPASLSFAARIGLPTTPASIFAVCYSFTAGICTGALVKPVADLISAGMRNALLGLVSDRVETNACEIDPRLIVGSFVGALTYIGAGHGFYHRIILPLLLIEMETCPSDFAIFGAIDLCTLCCTSAGICTAVWISPGHSASDKRLARFGAIQNIILGDFIEASYPFVEKSSWAYWSAVAASAIAGAIIWKGGCRSSAYLPLPLSLFICESRSHLCAAAMVSFGLPCATVLIESVLKT